MSATRAVVIGAGIGGLTTAAVLARAGIAVTVLEAHIYPGGCAGTFFHKQYRFEAGATLAGGFYPGGPMDIVAKQAGVPDWPAHPSEPAMSVKLPSGASVTRYGDERRWDERERAFGAESIPFWQWQERTADALWDLALRLPPWPAQTPGEFGKLAHRGVAWLGNRLGSPRTLGLLPDAFRPVAARLQRAPESLRTFVDGQLLIAAQTTSKRANALYGASALDLPRRGVMHFPGGIGAIAETLAEAVRAHGGEVRYRQEVTRILTRNGLPTGVETKRGDVFEADLVIANLPPWNLRTLLGAEAPPRLQSLPEQPEDGWGAFMVYAGIDERLLPQDGPLHHQVIVREPLGETNSIFISISPAWDAQRAPAGRRAVTMSTHTSLRPWWTLYRQDKTAYDRRKQAYVTRMLTAAEQVLPGLRGGADLILPGTPVTFQRFTRRAWGWVGGFPQTNLFRAWAPRIAPNLWMVGDSIFPGQSTAAVALGGLRVAEAVLAAAEPKSRTAPRKQYLPEPMSGD